MDRRMSRLATATAPYWAALLLLFFGLANADPADAQRKRGEVVVIDGQVLDRAGAPVTGVIAVLEATRSSYSWLKRRKVADPPIQQTVEVNEQGRFQIPWTWDRHHNEFNVAIGLEIARDGRRDVEILMRENISTAMNGGAPVHVMLTLEKAGLVRWLQGYQAGQATDDEKKVYSETGRPDRIETRERESSWWYFSEGKVYRFLNGNLEQVMHFDPMSPPASEPPASP